ncbi:hypothetical protein, partial [Helicobacter marmotae]|uniref:hypothetical protein n=1 Tax=Helicobacter marmotae TaxID=152490 RepID=UPI001F319DB8
CHHEPPMRGKELLSKTPKSTTSDSCRDSSVVSLPQNDNSGRVSSNSKRDSSLDSSSRHDKLCYPQGKPTHNKHLQEK